MYAVSYTHLDVYKRQNIWFGTTEKIGDTYYMWYEACNQYRERGLPDFLSVVGLATMKAPYFFVKPEEVI